MHNNAQIPGAVSQAGVDTVGACADIYNWTANKSGVGAGCFSYVKGFTLFAGFDRGDYLVHGMK